ncbi:MAG: hypothetical protein ACUVQH_14945, partial [Thermogutta sp.]
PRLRGRSLPTRERLLLDILDKPSLFCLRSFRDYRRISTTADMLFFLNIIASWYFRNSSPRVPGWDHGHTRRLFTCGERRTLG